MNVINLKGKDYSMTVSEWMKYLSNKDEHYPVSDEFIVKYQQSPANVNGYVYHAWKTGHIVHKKIAEPNQKWHFFEAYILILLSKNKISLDDSAEKIYRRIKCPELLLWIAEACCIEEKEIEKVSKVAQKIIDDKSRGARNAAGCKIREIITWNLMNLIKEKICNEFDI